MPAKKTTKKEVIKKKIVKKTAKSVAEKAPVEPRKTIAAARPKPQNNSVFGIMNIIAIIGSLIVFGLLAFGASKIPAKTPVAKNSPTNTQSVIFNCEAGETALAVLQNKADITTQTYDTGVFVDSINGVQNGNGSFWIFYINGQMASTSPDQYTCQPNDQIGWRLEKII